MTIYPFHVDWYASLIHNKILGSVTAFWNEGQTSAVKCLEVFQGAGIRIYFCVIRAKNYPANHDFLKADL